MKDKPKIKMNILDRIKNNSTITDAQILSESKLFKDRNTISTSIPLINIAFSGDINGGFKSGLTMWAGPSRHFKTCFALYMIKAFLDKYEDSVCLFYDSEFGSPQSYFGSFKIDTNRVFHTPIMNVEELKFDITKQLENIERTDKVIIVVDSIGNLASKKEIDDSLAEKSVADMTRAKQMKSLFRIVTPYLNMNDIPMVVVNHTYKEMSMFPRDVVSGGTGSMYSANNVFILGRSQIKEGTDVTGYNIIVKVEKSRYVREKSSFPVIVSSEHGINKYSGLIDIAIDAGIVTKPTKGYYCRKGMDEKVRLKDTFKAAFWDQILNDKDFQEYICKTYKVESMDGILDENV